MRYAVGIDFGTESGRAVLVDVATGHEVATAVHTYANGVIDECLPAPNEDVRLAADWALQDPADYIATIQATVPEVLRTARATPDEVVGIGIDFTSCTMLPTTDTGVPLCEVPSLRAEPHAWVKLWKHHAAQPEADRINAVAASRDEPWLPRYGGRISSEWFYSKALQILDEAPHVYAAADRMIEAADWIVWRLSGREVRNGCTAGYKAIWSKADGFPDPAFFAALDPRFERIVDDKMSRDIRPVGERAGGLTAEAAAWTRLLPGTPVAVANVDAHVSVPAVGVIRPGTMVAVMGTSTCHVVLGEREALAEGMCGVVEDGVIPGLFGFEAGQSAVGDIFAWFIRYAVPPDVHEAARRSGESVHTYLEGAGRAPPPGRERTARARLVERQSVDPRRHPPERPAGRRQSRDASSRHLPCPARGHRPRDARDHRLARGRRRSHRPDRRVRWPAGSQPPAHATHGRHHGPRGRRRGLEPGSGGGCRDVRDGGGRGGRWRLRLHRGGGGEDGAPTRAHVSA